MHKNQRVTTSNLTQDGNARTILTSWHLWPGRLLVDPKFEFSDFVRCVSCISVSGTLECLSIAVFCEFQDTKQCSSEKFYNFQSPNPRTTVMF